jgi:ribonuclease HI
MSQRLQIYSDGGARGNPGPAAIAFIALNERGETLKVDTGYIGLHTNNQAEYEALLLGLNYALEVDAAEVACYLDSELVAKQLNGEYAVKDKQLQVYWRKVREIKVCFKKINFYNVRRTHPQIQRADELVNETLDRQGRLNNKSQPIITEPMEAPSMFVHTSIRTRDLTKSIEFYTKYFGLKVKSQHIIKASNSEIAFLQDPAGKGCTLELTFYRDQKEFIQAQYEQRLFDHLGFEVADINKAISIMKKAGVTITDEPYKFNETTTIAFVEDTDGTLIELIERK